jgi:FtsP/CotA-like multicopper oxidase with cupredoxin domain
MALSRRALLGGGISAGLWAWSGDARADASGLALGVDGFFILEASPASLTLAADETHGLGYNGGAPGPLLRIRQGAVLKVRLRNKLAEPTTLSFPGLRAVNAAAGIGGLTQPPVAPGASLDIRFWPPDAGFNLYFPHAGAASAGQVSRGLFGPIVVEEAAPPGVDLEAVVVLSDWRLDPSGQLADLGQAELGRGAGRIGAVLTANSAPAPLLLPAAPGSRVRLRLANAATARVMGITIEGAKTSIVAVDGQPSEAFEPLHDLVPMAPGARFELLFDMPREAGRVVRFVLRGGDLGPVPGEPDRSMVVFEAKSAPPAGDRARTRQARRPDDFGRRRRPVRHRRSFVCRLGAEAVVRGSPRIAGHARPRQQDSSSRDDEVERPRRAAAAPARRRLGALWARHPAGRAGQDRPHGVRSGQSGKMADRIGEPGTTRSRAGDVVSGVVRATPSRAAVGTGKIETWVDSDRGLFAFKALRGGKVSRRFLRRGCLDEGNKYKFFMTIADKTAQSSTSCH